MQEDFRLKATTGMYMVLLYTVQQTTVFLLQEATMLLNVVFYRQTEIQVFRSADVLLL